MELLLLFQVLLISGFVVGMSFGFPCLPKPNRFFVPIRKVSPDGAFIDMFL